MASENTGCKDEGKDELVIKQILPNNEAEKLDGELVMKKTSLCFCDRDYCTEPCQFPFIVFW